MREIKFKFVLEDKKTGAKIISDPYTMKDIRNGFDDDRVYEDLEQKYGCDGNCTNESVAHCECGEVFPNSEIIKSIQYTGIKDMNGVEIFDGDILKIHFGIPPTFNTLLVEWYDDYIGDSSYCGWFFQGIGGSHGGPACSMYKDDLEIIGNIHQNPELLGK